MQPIIRSAVFAGVSVFALACCAPGELKAAPADSPPAAETITFAQYRDWRLHFIEQRQTQIAAELAAKDLPAERRASLDRQKAYYEFFASMSATERDRRFRERFNEMDANHDGVIDHNERAAWHEKQRAFYDRPYRRHVANDAAPR